MVGEAIVMTHEEADALASSVLNGSVYSHVAAAAMLAAYVREWAPNFKQVNENLTSVQARCTELLEECRALKREKAGVKVEYGVKVDDAGSAQPPPPAGARGKKDPP